MQKNDTVHAKQMKVGDSKTIPGGKREDEGYPTRQDSFTTQGCRQCPITGGYPSGM